MTAVVGGSRATGAYGTWLYPAIGLGAAIVIIAALDPRNVALRAVLHWPPLVWLGQRSYAVYLWNLVVLAVTRRFVHGHLAVGLLAIIGTITVAAFSMRFVERPFLQLKQRLAHASTS